MTPWLERVIRSSIQGRKVQHCAQREIMGTRGTIQAALSLFDAANSGKQMARMHGNTCFMHSFYPCGVVHICCWSVVLRSVCDKGFSISFFHMRLLNSSWRRLRSWCIKLTLSSSMSAPTMFPATHCALLWARLEGPTVTSKPSDYDVCGLRCGNGFATPRNVKYRTRADGLGNVACVDPCHFLCGQDNGMNIMNDSIFMR